MSETFDKNLGQKLKEVRVQLGMSQEEVAKLLNLESQAIVSQIENGTRKVKAQDLSKFAKIYHRDISYFLTEREESDQKTVVYWRNKRDEKLSKLKEQEFLKYCDNYYFLEKKLSLEHKCSLMPLSSSNYSKEDFTFDMVDKLAQEYYVKLQLGSRPACPLRKILEERYNLKILYYDLDDCGSAASSVGCFGSAILINSEEPLWRTNFNLAHELFHILTWHIFNYQEVHNSNNEKDPIEQMADSFAASLLLPHTEVLTEFKNVLSEKGTISLIDLVGMAREFEVSTEALMWRLVNLKMLKTTDVRKVFNSDDFSLIDKTARVKDNRVAPNISDRYLNYSFKAYQKGFISKGKLAEFLNINIGDVEVELARFGYNLEEVLNAELAVA